MSGDRQINTQLSPAASTGRRLSLSQEELGGSEERWLGFQDKGCKGVEGTGLQFATSGC